MKILVTGAAGFLGSHLVKSFLDDGHTVVGIDNLSSGRIKNLEFQFSNNNFQFHRHDICDPLLGLGKFDIIANLACQASPPKYQSDPYHTFMTSVKGIYNVVELARENDSIVFQASTSEVYGDPTVPRQDENYFGNVNCNGPRACYDEGKRAAETYLMLAREKYGTAIRIARIFNTYGPKMDPKDGRVISNFINQALEDKNITIYGTGNQTRSFCYIDDLIEGFRCLIETNVDTPVNLGNPNEMTVLDVAQKVIDKIGSDSRIEFHDKPVDDPMRRNPDISKAKMLLDWSPEVSFDEGLDKTIEYFKG